jgi:glycine cleavage system protein P-like pyridoxal-binding family
MFASTQLSPAVPAASAHELRFASLHQAGRAFAVPCDAQGQVDLDSLPRRLLMAYLGVRAMIGRDYALPVVNRGH